MANSGVNENGNVALELVLAVVLTVVFVIPAAVNVSAIFRSRIELIESISVMSRTFQKSVQSDIRENMQKAKEILQDGSDNELRIFIRYFLDQDGLINEVALTSIIETSAFGISDLDETIKIVRASFVP